MAVSDGDSVFVAFLDILGIKNIILQKSHNDIAEIYDRMSPNIDLSVTHSQLTTIEKDGKPIKVANLKESKINSLFISDSVIFWANDDSMLSFFNICHSVKHLMKAFLINGLPLRGTITLGPITVKSNMPRSNLENIQIQVFGKSVVSAYQSANNQDWMGCVVDSKAIDHYMQLAEQHKSTHSLVTIELLEKFGYLMKYKVPYKTGPVGEEYVIRWYDGPNDGGGFIRERFGTYGQFVDDWSIERKILNTISFIQSTGISREEHNEILERGSQESFHEDRGNGQHLIRRGI